MRSFLVRIVMCDGSAGEHHGFYASGCDAVIFALDIFPNARRISARRKP
jgi:hypothetical protein